MAEPEGICDFLEDHFNRQLDPVLRGKTILITAGPTYEAIDPVRFIGNYSSGKMGFQLAQECLDRGMNVILVYGPVNCNLEHPNLRKYSVRTAQEMLDKTQSHWNDCDFGIFAAAVADYRPQEVAENKIKKGDDELQLKLVRNPDILKWAGMNKKQNQILVGFALETNDQEANAIKKLQSKNLDFIVLNSPNDPHSAFGYETNKITILDRDNNRCVYELKSKQLVAVDVVNYLKKMYE
jgi:phosphopantothenoylcysteine decarboxylase/phosphopantothenate--cysteine ligase